MPLKPSLALAALILAGTHALLAHGTPLPPRPAHAAPKTAATEGTPYGDRDDAMRLAQDIAQRNQWDVQWVRTTLAQARMVPAIVRAMTPAGPGSPKNWAAYRSRFIEPQRIRAGVAFWQANQASLARAEAQSGVPARIIVGIVGVETLYGRHLGRYRVIDALCTLSLDFPDAHPRKADRSAYFAAELEAYLGLMQRTGTDPMEWQGSYAGAMGWPQFMPSSWVRYGTDFDADQRVDLFHSQADVIGSVARYFEAFQWRRGMPTHYAVTFDPLRVDMPTLLAKDIVPTFTAADMQDKGAVLSAQGRRHTGPLALIELKNGDAAPSYVAGTENFYALTRYNWSSYYAMAVIELGDAVANARASGARVPK